MKLVNEPYSQHYCETFLHGCTDGRADRRKGHSETNSTICVIYPATFSEIICAKYFRESNCYQEVFLNTDRCLPILKCPVTNGAILDMLVYYMLSVFMNRSIQPKFCLTLVIRAVQTAGLICQADPGLQSFQSSNCPDGVNQGFMLSPLLLTYT